MEHSRQEMVNILYGILLLLSTTSVLSQNVTTEPDPNVPVPPLIVQDPLKVIAFKQDESIEIQCVANGNPKPNYTWYLNGVLFDPSGIDGRVIMLPGVGTLLFVRPLERDEGIYQCFAENSLGTAVSVKAHFKMAYLEPFSPSPTRHHRPLLGSSLTLRCTPPKSHPAAQIFWGVMDSNGALKPLNMSIRVTTDPEGNLQIVQVLEEDHFDGNRYTCLAQNTVMRQIQQGEYNIITPYGDSIMRYPPQLLYIPPTHQMALLNETWRVKCIFSGSPPPRVLWTRRDNTPLPSTSRQESHGLELVVDNVQFEDGGRYECQGINEEALVPIRRSLVLKVEAAPYWINKPESIDAFEGDIAVFHCETEGIPESINFWFLNGIPIEKSPARHRVEVNTTHLVFSNVMKTDAQVIQCNSTNKHGYVFTNAYLNVLVHQTTAEEYLTTTPSITSQSDNTTVQEESNITVLKDTTISEDIRTSTSKTTTSEDTALKEDSKTTASHEKWKETTVSTPNGEVVTENSNKSNHKDMKEPSAEDDRNTVGHKYTLIIGCTLAVGALIVVFIAGALVVYYNKHKKYTLGDKHYTLEERKF